MRLSTPPEIARKSFADPTLMIAAVFARNE
jgi:hypothetical protein